jgi:hypothetical protein
MQILFDGLTLLDLNAVSNVTIDALDSGIAEPKAHVRVTDLGEFK